MDIYEAFNRGWLLTVVGPREKRLVRQNKYVNMFMMCLSHSALLGKALENGTCYDTL